MNELTRNAAEVQRRGRCDKCGRQDVPVALLTGRWLCDKDVQEYDPELAHKMNELKLK